jgi:hypothetical protein
LDVAADCANWANAAEVAERGMFGDTAVADAALPAGNDVRAGLVTGPSSLTIVATAVAD